MPQIHHAITFLIEDSEIKAIDALCVAEMRNSRDGLSDTLDSPKNKKIYDALGIVIDYFTGDSDGEDDGEDNNQD